MGSIRSCSPFINHLFGVLLEVRSVMSMARGCGDSRSLLFCSLNGLSERPETSFSVANCWSTERLVGVDGELGLCERDDADEAFGGVDVRLGTDAMAGLEWVNLGCTDGLEFVRELEVSFDKLLLVLWLLVSLNSKDFFNSSALTSLEMASDDGVGRRFGDARATGVTKVVLGGGCGTSTLARTAPVADPVGSDSQKDAVEDWADCCM